MMRTLAKVETAKLSKTNHKTVYDEFMSMRIHDKPNKHLAMMIIESAIEDCDYEFLTDDYDEWKKYRLQRKKHQEVLNEVDLRTEFNFHKTYKELIMELAGLYVSTQDIPQSIKDERSMFENNCLKNLKKFTSYDEFMIKKISKEHGWKIGLNYVEPTIFDL